MRPAVLVFVQIFVLAVPVMAGTLVTLERPEFYDLQAHGFELPREVELEIDAVGRLDRGTGSWLARVFHAGRDEPFSAYAWLLNADTRRAVWVMEEDDASRVSTTLRRIETTLRLGPGRYELYLFSGHEWADGLEDDDPGGHEDWWDRIWSGAPRKADDLRRAIRDELDECHVTLSANGLSASDLERFEVTGDLPGAIARFNRVGDSSFVTGGVAVDRATRFRVYSIIEQTRGSRDDADYGWIVDASTREVVWHPRHAESSPAGGHEKNRRLDDEVELEAGRYLVYFGTDDSHSFDGFNAGPPHDPFNWGLTLLPGEGYDASAVRVFDPADPGPALIDLTRVANGESREQAFRLTRNGSLHVQALGESASGYFADFAWIAEAGTGRTVWEMNRQNTMGAGGSSKNRMFDGLVDLPRGDYLLLYVADGSHAFESWNAATPFRPDAWGVSLRPGPGFDVRTFESIDPDRSARSKDVLVRLVRVGDEETMRERFALDEAARVRVHAVGEGLDGEMYDYGYIVEGRTGSRVWEMTYDRTGHAGGADKNRDVEEELALEPGTYEAVYVTDGTHSFDGWNGPRPRDPLGWGLTIRLVEP